LHHHRFIRVRYEQHRMWYSGIDGVHQQRSIAQGDLFVEP
jgi:hypothetical protein